MSTDSSEIVRFGDYEYCPDRRSLTRRGERIRLGSRASALLHALALRNGYVVPNQDLMVAAWPDTHVDPTNLRVQMGALRRALEDDEEQQLIINISGRGYSLRQGELSDAREYSIAYRHPPAGLTSPLNPILGREAEAQSVVERVASHRLVTLVGPGGIGKTRLAIEVCWRLARGRSGQICFVDLAPLASAEFLASAIASALEISEVAGVTAIDRVTSVLKHRDVLLVLDNCEHLLDDVAIISDVLLRNLPNLSLVTTSREPLGIAGEATLRLDGLAVPDPTNLPKDLDEALAFPAVRLLVERALAGSSDLVLTDVDVPALVQICLRLDCIPLAIELAAPRVAAFGVKGLLANIDVQLNTLGEGTRSTSPRHRTLWATLQWSFSHLSKEEQQLLKRLACFRSSFPLAGVNAMSPFVEANTTSCLANLVNKSLVVVDRSRAVVRYRLLETTRNYAEDQLTTEPDHNDVRRLHAEYVHSTFVGEPKHEGPAEDRLDTYRRSIDDVRSAISWAMGPEGDVKLGMRLIGDSAPIWLRLSILTEYAMLLRAAARALWDQPGIVSQEARWLASSLHIAHYNTLGLSPEVERMLLRALESSQLAHDDKCTLICFYCVFGTRLTQARYTEALEAAQSFRTAAQQLNDELQLAMGRRVVAISHWRNGEFLQALEVGQAALAPSLRNVPLPEDTSLIYKQGVAARGNHSNLLWLLGFCDQARSLADEAIEVGLKEDVIGLCYSLAHTLIPLSFWLGDLRRARRETDLLLELARDADLGLWLFWGHCYESIADHLQRQTVATTGFLAQNEHRLDGLHQQILSTIVSYPKQEWLVDRDPLRKADSHHWCQAELMRKHALSPRHELAERKRILEKALEVAKAQGAFSWELRASTSLAQLLESTGDRGMARSVLSASMDRVREGASTVDVQNATQLLSQL